MVFLSEKNYFELFLRKEKPRQVVFKLSFQDIGILGLHCTLHLLKSEAPRKVFVTLILDQKSE